MNVSQEDILQHAIASAKAAGAAQVDSVLVMGDGFESRVRDKEVDFVTQSKGRTLGIRALISGKEGFRQAVTSTSDLAFDAVARMAQETVALARATADDPTAGLPEEDFCQGFEDLELKLLDEADRNVSVEARIEDARRAETAARKFDERIINSEGSQVSSSFAGVGYANSKGFLGTYESASHSLFSEPLAGQGDEKQRDYWMTVGRSLSSLEEPDSVGRQAAQRALRRLQCKPIPTCEVPVIFEPLTAASLVGHIAGCLSGYAVYRKSSFLAGRMGEQVGSEHVSVIDDGLLPGGLGSKPFDGEGLATRRNTLLENGVVQSYLLDSYSGRKLGLPSTGSASRGAGSAPGAGATNLWLEPGKMSQAEMIAGIDKGLLVTELIGMGFNAVTGDYSRGAVGLWIEKGEVVHPVEEITIASDLTTMLMNIDAVGNDLLWLGRVAAPSLRVSNMTVAGNS
ncbi:MAG: TldD/PmbA family protein [Deltaproteobacteria bacterium]|nr:TldD/PmbA family protein [Deltaproteobacteria bacterium]